MLKILRNKDFNVTDFLVDDMNGVTYLANTNTCAPGSTVYVIETGETYIKNIDDEWTVKIQKDEGEMVEPSGTLEIIDNGLYDVANYANANVNIPKSKYQFEQASFYRYPYDDVSDGLAQIDHNALVYCMNMFSTTMITRLDLSDWNISGKYLDDMFVSSVFLDTVILGEGWLGINNNNWFESGVQIIKDIFGDTPIDGGDGYIYVPDNLVDTFKSDAFFSKYANNIKSINELS